MQTKGVDISEHNGAVDFAALTQAGVKFAILRLGYGSDYTSQDDAQFAQNVRKAEAAGMPWGAYLYSYAKDASMAQSEARHALRLLQGRKPLYGVWYDVEDSQIAGADLVATCQTFCAAMEAAGAVRGHLRLPQLADHQAEQPPAGPVRQVGGPVEQRLHLPKALRHLAVHGQAGHWRPGV